MVKLDLHCHVSEQKRSIIEFFKECAEQGVNIVAITDHKTLKAFTERIYTLTPEEIKEIPPNVRVLIGIEMTGKYRYTNSAGQTSYIAIDILGYNLDLSKENQLDSWKNENYVDTDSPEFQREELKRLIEKAKELEWEADYGTMDIDESDPNKRFAGRVLAEGLRDERYREHNLKRGLSSNVIENPRNFFNIYCKKPESPFYIDFSPMLPEIGGVMDIIRKCGGMVFVPHIAAYNSKTGDSSEKAKAWQDSRDLAKKIIEEYGERIDGIEVIHPMNDSPRDEFAEFLYDLAEKNGLYVSGGTDYHQPGETLGKDAKGRTITPERLPGIGKWIKAYTIQTICEMVRANKAKEAEEAQGSR